MESFIFFHWIRSRNLARKPCAKGYRSNKGHCTFPAGSRWIPFSHCRDGKYSGEFLWGENQSLKKDEHYQLSGSKNQRIHNNTKKISSVFTDYEVSLEESENVFNVLTKKSCPKKWIIFYVESPAPKNQWKLWIICYRKTWRLVLEVHSSILITTSDHIILNEAGTLMRELIFAKTKSLLNNRTHEIHENQFSWKSILFWYTGSYWAWIQFF